MKDCLPHHAFRRTGLLRGRRGFTLIETLVSLALLVLTGVGGVSGFMLLNRYASDNRDRAAAKALCQERVEQILTLPFNPKAGIVPAVVGQDNNTYYLLGLATTATPPSYDSSNNYIGGANQQTSSTFNSSGEPVTISLQPNGNATAATPVNGFRTTTISAAPSSTPGLCLMNATVTVTWNIRGTTNTYTLYALRSPD